MQTLAVEFDHVGKEPLTSLLTSHGYKVLQLLEVPGGKDLLFTRNAISTSEMNANTNNKTNNKSIL